MAQDRPRATIYGLSALDSTLLLKNLGVKASGVVQSQVMPLSSNTALAGEYHSALKQFSTNETPSYFGMEGFLEAKVLVSALRKPGASKSSQTLTTALESLSRLDVGGVEVQYSQSSRRGSSYTQLTILNDRGQVVR